MMEQLIQGGAGRRPRASCGLGLRREHYRIVLDERPDVPFFEVISENFMVEGGRPLHVLENVRESYPVALHGVSLSPGSAEPLCEDYLAHLEALVRRVDPVFVSDHLCWTRGAGHNSHDLLPLPFTEEAIGIAASRIGRVQERLRRRILIENVSTYVRFADPEMGEWEFVAAVAERADCGILLDVNNVYVNARNHGFDPMVYLAAVPADRVQQFHLGGHEDHVDYIIDTHDRAITKDVWGLYGAAVARFGPRPTIIERDEDVPPFQTLQAEMARAQEILDDRCLA